MKSAQKGGGGSRNTPNLRTNSIDFADREMGGSKNPIILWTSFFETP